MKKLIGGIFGVVAYLLQLAVMCALTIIGIPFAFLLICCAVALALVGLVLALIPLIFFL